jgi:hypothetical protein
MLDHLDLGVAWLESESLRRNTGWQTGRNGTNQIPWTHFDLGGGVPRKRIVAQEYGSNVTVSVEGRKPLGKAGVIR